jgi:hypothetical protein
MTIKSTLLGLTASSLLLMGAGASAAAKYEVTITNLTRAQTFTPIMVVSHKPGFKLFTLGTSASDELAALAEDGDEVPLTGVANVDPSVIDVSDSGGLLTPGASVTVSVDASGGAKEISLASMLIPTNDAFISLNGVRAPKGNKTLTYYSVAYDAGSEPNDELCAYIPGPYCGGMGASPGVGGEGYVHIHAGIHGIGDLAPDVFDWRNPVAKITISRTK